MLTTFTISLFGVIVRCVICATVMFGLRGLAEHSPLCFVFCVSCYVLPLTVEKQTSRLTILSPF